MDIEKLQEKTGYVFRDKQLLETAMTHSSYSNENRAQARHNNERLEFLGDSVLGLVVSDYLFRLYPDLPEGELTRLRASLVCESSLSGVAHGIGLGDYLLLGRGEQNGGGRGRSSILADATEALIGALYLDGGYEAARVFIKRFLFAAKTAGLAGAFKDYKTSLQELVQKERQNTLYYRMVGESGPDHAKRFVSQVLINGDTAGQGEGENKKAAEQAAAHEALKQIYGWEE